MAPVTLTKTFGFRGIQYMWNSNDNYGWMSDTLGGKFNFYYRVGDMVTDGILDAGRNAIQDDIMVKLRTWYIKQIHDKVTTTGITDSDIVGWKTFMDNVDEKSIRKNGKFFDLIDAEAFNLAHTKYDELPHVDIEDSNFFIIYLIPDNLYPIDDKRISCMRYQDFKFTPQTPVAASGTTTGTFGLGFGTTDMNRFSAAITTGFENAQSSKNIDLQQYDPATQKGTPLEVIIRYRGRVNCTSFYTKSDMPLFNNELTDDGTGATQDQCYVLSPKGSTILLVYSDGTLFQNLAKYNLTGKDRTALISQTPKLKGWDARSWYTFYNEMVRTCSNNKCWLLPYLMVVDCKDIDDFSIGETQFDGDCDLPMTFGNQVDNWDNALYSMISQDNILPSGEARDYVTGGGGKGYAFFHYGNRKFYVALMDFLERVYASHPKQEGRSFEEYMNLVLFHYAMVAFKMDQKLIFDNESTQNIFISNMDDSNIIWDEVQRERCSPDSNTADKYREGNFLNTLGQLIN